MTNGVAPMLSCDRLQPQLSGSGGLGQDERLKPLESNVNVVSLRIFTSLISLAKYDLLPLVKMWPKNQ